jgi:hypothetical protein
MQGLEGRLPTVNKTEKWTAQWGELKPFARGHLRSRDSRT